MNDVSARPFLSGQSRGFMHKDMHGFSTETRYRPVLKSRTRGVKKKYRLLKQGACLNPRTFSLYNHDQCGLKHKKGASL